VLNPVCSLNYVAHWMEWGDCVLRTPYFVERKERARALFFLKFAALKRRGNVRVGVMLVGRVACAAWPRLGGPRSEKGRSRGVPAVVGLQKSRPRAGGRWGETSAVAGLTAPATLFPRQAEV